MKSYLASLLLVLLLVLLPTVSVHSATYTETGDAGATPGTAQVVSGPANTALDAINGSLPLTSGVSEADVFQIFISDPNAFSASTDAFSLGTNNFNTQLFLFDSTGRGVFGNDDSPTGGQTSTLPAGSSFMSGRSAGLYYLLIDGGGRYPADSSSQLIFPNFTDGSTAANSVVGPTGPGGANPFTQYNGNSSEGGNYSIALTGAQFVPEPSSIVLALAGAGLLCAWNRRRTR
jgi:hypothetical protein